MKITNKTETHKIIQDTITDNLKGSITYCVCLLLNNSYIETQNKKLVNNPPKIPYIDLTEAYSELNRFYRRNKYIEEQKPNPSNLVFVKYYSKEDKRAGRTNYVLTKPVRESITEITGFSYEEFTSKNFHIHIFENINTYMLYCYSAAIKNFTIPPGKISEINKEFEYLKKLADSLRESMVYGGAGVRIIQEIINQAKKYLFLIEVMNGTSVIGTIDFADEISKYNLKYNKSSVSQFNILHKSRSELYASDYDYLRRFRYFLDGVAPSIDNLALGVHAFIPITKSVLNLVWRCFILPALLKLGEGHSIYHSLIKNKMKICLEHSTNPVIKRILEPYRDETKDLMKLTTVEIDDTGQHDDYLKEVNVSKESFDIIKVSKANKRGQPGEPLVLKFEVPLVGAPSAPPGISVELDYPKNYNDTARINEEVKPLVAKLNSLPPKLRMEKIIEKITNIKNQRFYLKTLIDAQTKNKKITAFKSEIKALQEKETREEQERAEQKIKDHKFKQYNDTNGTQIKEKEKVILLGLGGNREDGRTIKPCGLRVAGIDSEKKEKEINIQAKQPATVIDIDIEEGRNMLLVKFDDSYIESVGGKGAKVSEDGLISLGLVKILNDGEGDDYTQVIGGLSSDGGLSVITEVDFPKYESILQREQALADAKAHDDRIAAQAAERAAAMAQREADRAQQLAYEREQRRAQQQAQLAFEQQMQPRGRRNVGKLNTNQFQFQTGQGVRQVGFGTGAPRGRGGSKTRKYSKLKLKQPKKIERKYKQSLKNKVKVNHSQVNHENLLNEYLNNKTKRHLRLKLKEKKKLVKKYKKSFKK